MRKALWGLACIAGLSACADGTGQVMDPRYRFDGAGGYDQYRAARESALTGKAAVPQVVPKARPFKAPTAEQIASPTAVQRVTAGTRRVSGAAQGGGYYDPDTGRRLAPNPARAAAPRTETDALARYAAAQRHAPGSRVYARAGGSAADAAHACARFPNPDAAQLMFLTAGGPDQDTMGMDPDGDGFVCGWTPASYRAGSL